MAEWYFTVKEAAERARCSVKTIYRAIRHGDLKASRPTAHYRIAAGDLEAWLSSERVPALRPAMGSAAAVSPRGSASRLREIEDEAA